MALQPAGKSLKQKMPPHIQANRFEIVFGKEKNIKNAHTQEKIAYEAVGKKFVTRRKSKE